MFSPRNEPFPFSAVQDLLAIMRAMYLVFRAEGSTVRAERLRKAALELRAATALARKCEPGTMGHAAAWRRAEDATQLLGDLVDCTTSLLPTLEAATNRVRRVKVGGAMRGKGR